MADDKPEITTSRATPRQMALDLYEEMINAGMSVSQSKREIGYPRTNLFAEIVNLSLTTRRFLDAAYFIVSQESGELEQYDVDLSYFRWLMRYDSRNLKHLRTIADEAQNSKIRVTDTPKNREPTDNDLWVQVQLVGLVGFHRGRITFDIHKKLLPHIRDPRKSHWLSLRISTAFTRSLARAIYDKVLVSVPEGRTEWVSLDEVRTWPGKMGKSAEVFKYFKRDWLDPAVREINEVSDIELTYQTGTATTSSKKIDRIRFHLKRKDTADAVMADLMGADQVYKALTSEFSLSAAQLREISENRDRWTDERIMAAIEYTRWKISQGVVKRTPAGYLMRCIRDNLRMSPAEREMQTVAARIAASGAQSENAKAQNAANVARQHVEKEDETRTRLDNESRLGWERYSQSDDQSRAELMRLWVTSMEGKLILRRKKLAPTKVNEAQITGDGELAWYLGQFVFGRMKAESGKT